MTFTLHAASLRKALGVGEGADDLTPVVGNRQEGLEVLRGFRRPGRIERVRAAGRQKRHVDVVRAFISGVRSVSPAT